MKSPQSLFQAFYNDQVGEWALDKMLDAVPWPAVLLVVILTLMLIGVVVSTKAGRYGMLVCAVFTVALWWWNKEPQPLPGHGPGYVLLCYGWIFVVLTIPAAVFSAIAMGVGGLITSFIENVFPDEDVELSPKEKARIKEAVRLVLDPPISLAPPANGTSIVCHR
jgi:hypothetical protein